MKIWDRFYIRISLVFLVLIVILAALQARITSDVFDRRRDEIDQRANAMLAADMAREIAPYLAAGEDGEIGSAIHYMMVLNPKIEIYLLSPDGDIRVYFADSEEDVKTDRVDTGPIGDYLSGKARFPLYGDDPRRPDMPSTFSAAPLEGSGGVSGYLYIILRSSLYDSARSQIADYYYRVALRRGLLTALPLVAVLGLVMFFLLTRRLRRLRDVVRTFGPGSYGVRAPGGSRDEIGELAGSFNTMAAAIERSEANRRELVANISHDLRTPLSVISGYTETLLQRGGSLEEDERKRFLEISRGSVETIQRLVDDLASLSRLEAEEDVLNQEPFSLAELCQDLTLQLAPLAAKAGVALRMTPPADHLMVSGDIPLMERALTNLIDNALRYAPAGTTVEVRAARLGTSARVEVRDRGPGLTSEQMSRVFDRFFTGDPSRSSGHSGLGLAIALRVVERHGGTIGVDSTPGEGAAFHFRIPLLQK